MSLRTLLIVVGVVIVAAVWFVGTRMRQRDSRVSFDHRFNRADLPDPMRERDDAPASGDDGVVGPVRVLPADAVPPPRLGPRLGARLQPRAEAEPRPGGTPARAEPHISRLPDDVVLPPEHLILDELPVVRNDEVEPPERSNGRPRADQLDLFGSVADSAAAPRRTPARPAPKPPPADDGVISLYVRAREGQQIAGSNLVRGFNAVGMQHGDMAIFHHFGAGDLKCNEAVFSAANMFEPGTFDLGRIEAFRTAGIALFMQLPGPLDGPVAFELLLNTAQRLTELVGGELYVTPQARLDSKSIARLRARAALFPDARR